MRNPVDISPPKPGVVTALVEEACRVPQSPFLSVILPAYNEAGAIRRTLASIRAFLDRKEYRYEVIVAADGNDATPQIVQELASDWPGLQLTVAPGRHGKGHGLRRGMALARGEVVGFLDADYKTAIDDMDRLLPWLSRGYDIAAGSRALSDSRIERYQPVYRQVGSKVFALGMHLLVGLNEIRDTQCGFKFFTRQAALDIFSRTKIDGYMCDVEILWLAEKLGYRVKEVGIQWRDDGDSRLELFRGNLRNMAELFAIRLGKYALDVRHPAGAALNPGVEATPEP